MANDLIVRVRGRATTTRDLITRVRGRAAAAITVTLGDARTVEPGDVVELSASASRVPDSWSWEQTDGSTVLLTGSGGTRTYTAPATLNGTDLTFRVTVTIAGGTPAFATVSHHVLQHTMWRPAAGGGITPILMPAP